MYYTYLLVTLKLFIDGSSKNVKVAKLMFVLRYQKEKTEISYRRS